MRGGFRWERGCAAKRSRVEGDGCWVLCAGGPEMLLQEQQEATLGSRDGI
jgi:hypothetical protein